MTELETLRVSMARIAQTLGLHDYIPGATTYWPAPFHVLALAAKTEQRGWNALAERINDACLKLKEEQP